MLVTGVEVGVAVGVVPFVGVGVGVMPFVGVGVGVVPVAVGVTGTGVPNVLSRAVNGGNHLAAIF